VRASTRLIFWRGERCSRNCDRNAPLAIDDAPAKCDRAPDGGRGDVRRAVGILPIDSARTARRTSPSHSSPAHSPESRPAPAPTQNWKRAHRRRQNRIRRDTLWILLRPRRNFTQRFDRNSITAPPPIAFRVGGNWQRTSHKGQTLPTSSSPPRRHRSAANKVRRRATPARPHQVWKHGQVSRQGGLCAFYSGTSGDLRCPGRVHPLPASGLQNSDHFITRFQWYTRSQFYSVRRARFSWFWKVMRTSRP